MLLAKMDEHHYSRSNPEPVRFPLSKHLSKEKNISEVAVISRLSVRISLTAELIELSILGKMVLDYFISKLECQMV